MVRGVTKAKIDIFIAESKHVRSTYSYLTYGVQEIVWERRDVTEITNARGRSSHHQGRKSGLMDGDISGGRGLIITVKASAIWSCQHSCQHFGQVGGGCIRREFA
jgi:hypothetical protein